jgi:hypothetical protein
MIDIHSKTSKQKCYIIVAMYTNKKSPINNDTNYIIRPTMSTNKIHYLTLFFKTYKGMQVIITQNLYLKLQNFNESIGHTENKIFIDVKWI